MREILFRGKANFDGRDGEWIYGGLLPETENTFPIIVRDYDNDEDWIGVNGWDTVYPETIGQYTGLTDKNGKKIFEGDIVEGHCHSQWSHRLQRCVVVYDRDGFESRHYVKQGEVMRYYSYKVLFSKDVEVIGNIHDNPELLEGDAE